MVKRMITLCLCSLLIGMAVLPGIAMAAEQGLVIGDEVVMQAAPATGTEVIATLDPGVWITVLGEEGSWYHIRFDALEGYAYKRSVVVEPEWVTASQDELRVYALPSSDGKIVKKVNMDEVLYVIDEWEDYWAVSVAGGVGFALKDEFAYSGEIQEPLPTRTPRPTSTTATPSPTPVAARSYIVTHDTAQREEPYAWAASNSVMTVGSIVRIGRIQGGFGQNVDNRLWLNMDDLTLGTILPTPKPEETVPPDGFRYLIIRDGAHVYINPDAASDILDTLYDGDVVTLSRTQDGFGLVQYGRQRGWVQLTDMLSFHR